METIHKVLKSHQSKGFKPLRARVIKVVQEEGKDDIRVVLADKSGSCRAITYRPDLLPKLKGTILIKEFNKGRSSIIFNKKTIISPAGELHLDTQIISTAEKLINPTIPPMQDISTILQMEEGTMVTVEGVVQQVNFTYVLRSILAYLALAENNIKL